MGISHWFNFDEDVGVHHVVHYVVPVDLVNALLREMNNQIREPTQPYRKIHGGVEFCAKNLYKLRDPGLDENFVVLQSRGAESPIPGSPSASVLFRIPQGQEWPYFAILGNTPIPPCKW